MSQKSITSFFKPKITTETESNKQTSKNAEKPHNANSSIEEEESLDRISKSMSKKRRPIISSEDEEETSASDVTKDDARNSPPKSKKIALSSDSPNSKSPIKTEETKSPSAKPKNAFSILGKLNSTENKRNVDKSPLKPKKTALSSASPVKSNTTNSKTPIKTENPSETKSSPVKPSQPKNAFSMMGKMNSTENKLENKYNPGKENYDPIKDAFWKKGESTPYLALARTFEIIEDTRGRLKMIDLLSNFFSSVIALNPDDLLPCVYMSINQVAPAYEGLELGVAEHTLMKVVCKATGRDMNHTKAQVQKTGDLGIVAEQSRIAQPMMFRPAALTVNGLFQKLKVIAKTTGPSKMNMIQDIYVACRYSEARYFIRSLIGKLRIGIAEQSLMQALAAAIVKNSSKKSQQSAAFKSEVDETVLILRTAFSQCPNYDKIIPTLLNEGINKLLELCPMEPGIPLKPMLAHPTKSIGEVLERFENSKITCEWKYDGERAQIHCDSNGKISIYSRNQENNTAKYPDVISRVQNFVSDKVKSFIVDSEIVAWDIEQQQILPFQVLSTRKRKGVEMEDIKVQVCVYAFDLLYLNEQPLVTEQFIERRRLLLDNFKEMKGEWQFATAMDTSDTDEIQQFLEESIKGNCEGLMVKTLDKEASYEIAKRSRNWLKLKKDYLSSCGDSLDLVVMGGYRGRGKRTGTYGGFLLACYDSENEEYQTICKIGTGFSEDDLRKHTEFFKDHVLSEAKSYFRFDNSLTPDDWFEPVQVWEVKCADLSLSPIHRAGIGTVDPERGISLRFPRFIRIRDDKSPENATSAQQVASMYSSQDQIKNQQQGAAGNNEFDNDFY